jgi:hypothetical protein
VGVWDAVGNFHHFLKSELETMGFPTELEVTEDVAGISIDDVSVVEGDRGTRDAVFAVSLGTAAMSVVTVRYTAVAGTASPNDFTPKSGTVTFRVGQSSRTIVVKVKGDRRDENDEVFFVRLSNASGASIADGEGVGTILDDDTLSADGSLLAYRPAP